MVDDKPKAADVKGMINIPKEINEMVAEETGAHIGDGSMGIYNEKYIISFGGHPIDDKYYYKWLANVYKQLYKIKVKLKKWSGVYGFQVFSRELVKFKQNLGLPVGPKLNINIPKIILNSKNTIIAACIRGIFDTDGTLFFEKRKSKVYPRIQLKVSSFPLTKTINEILNKKFGLKSTLYKNKEKSGTYYFVELRGYENLLNWMKIIGFHNIKHLSKFILWKNGFNPRVPINERLKIIREKKLAIPFTAEAFNLS